MTHPSHVLPRDTFMRARRLAALAGIYRCIGVAMHSAAADSRASPYAPYEFLIGSWNISPDRGGPPIATANFRWGPNHAYIWYAGAFLANGVERPHFEGLLVWNGASRRLDMLLSMDLDRGLVQEQGAVYSEPDGTVVREITATYSEGVTPIGQTAAGHSGATAHFRQTFKALAPDRVSTSVMRQSDQGWIATFPGSDHLVMTRRTTPS